MIIFIGNHNPGAGGWPTIKYFNKETGYEGAPYDKRTDKSMCDELGDDQYMEDYVTSAGKTSLCDVISRAGCSNKEDSFIDKWSSKWTSQRAAILNQLAKSDGSEAEL